MSRSITKTLEYKFTEKHRSYMRNARDCVYNIAEGAVRAGKTVDNVSMFAILLDRSPDKFHLASGSTVGNAKLNIGACNGLGLENIFRGRCRWGKHLNNEALFIRSRAGLKIVIFAGGGKADSFKSIRGNSYGYWIATEIDQHHKSFIEEALARQLMARDMKLFWDLNPNTPKHFIYEEYIDAWSNKEMGGGYNYEHFTIYDNASLSEQNKQIILSRYTSGTLSHSRNILGLRIVAEGLIYKEFADNERDYHIAYDDAKKLTFRYIYAGVDIGGTTSKHAFVLSGITQDWKLIALRSEILETDLNPDKLALAFVRFIRACSQDFRIDNIYFESAEQVLKRGFKSKLTENGFYMPIRNSIKNKVNERINALETLIAQSRFYFTERADTVRSALSEAVWDAKATEKGEDKRLDDGTTDIDTLDAFEYSWERHIAKLIRLGGE